MKTLSLCLVFLATTACAGTRGSGVIKSESRPVTPFKELRVSGGLEVVFRKAAEPSLRIEADDNLLPLVASRVDGERLIVELKSKGGVDPSRPIHVVVTAPTLKRIEASGGVDVTIESGADRDFSVEASGGVELSAPSIDADTVKVHASGGVTLAMAGRAKTVVWDTSGGVGVKAKDLAAASVKVEASGGCSLDIAASESVTGDISGGADLTLHGNPSKSRVHASGGADVRYAD